MNIKNSKKYKVKYWIYKKQDLLNKKINIMLL